MERTSPEVTASSGILVAGIGNIFFSDDGFGPEAVIAEAVSYTHLTLPTICSV